jgi:hypothetical protein
LFKKLVARPTETYVNGNNQAFPLIKTSNGNGVAKPTNGIGGLSKPANGIGG